MEPVIRHFREKDLTEAEGILRLSFGIFLGMADPMKFFGDSDYVSTRFKGGPGLCLAAAFDGHLGGSNFIANREVRDFLHHLRCAQTVGLRELQKRYLITQ